MTAALRNGRKLARTARDSREPAAASYCNSGLAAICSECSLSEKHTDSHRGSPWECFGQHWRAGTELYAIRPLSREAPAPWASSRGLQSNTDARRNGSFASLCFFRPLQTLNWSCQRPHIDDGFASFPWLLALAGVQRAARPSLSTRRTMSRYAQFGHRSAHSDGLSASDPDRGCCLMALQFRKHLTSTAPGPASSSRSAAPRSILSQTLHCKLAKRALYVTVTHGTSTTLWRFDWPQIARRRRSEADQGNTLVLVARIVWAAADTSGRGKKKSTPTVERAGTVTSVDALLPGGGGFMKGDR